MKGAASSFEKLKPAALQLLSSTLYIFRKASVNVRTIFCASALRFAILYNVEFRREAILANKGAAHIHRAYLYLDIF
jgi:hypothetical protein